MSHAPVAIDVIVEGKFFVPQNFTVRKDAHSDVLAYGPLGDVAVRIAAMIGESTDTTPLGGVKELTRQAQAKHRLRE